MGQQIPTGWFQYQNKNAAQVPARGILRVISPGAQIVDGRGPVLQCDQPNIFGDWGTCLINQPVPVAANGFGCCTRFDPENGGLLTVLYDDADGTPAVDEIWGPRNGTWKLKKNTGGFRVIKVTNSDQHLVMVQPVPMTWFLGKADATIAKGSAGTISIYDYGTFGSESDTGENMSGVLARFGALTVGKWVACSTRDGKNWEGLQTEC